jgi:carboxypeptidase C (cathepsin A)
MDSWFAFGDRSVRWLAAARWSLLTLLLASALVAPAFAQGEGEVAADTEAAADLEAAGDGEGAAAEVAAGDEERLPAASTTRHSLDLGDRVIDFSATAGALTLTSGAGRAEADIGFVGYLLDGPAEGDRPVTFAVNGGPGAASAYLHLGVLGPWRLPVGVESIVPSQPVGLVPNAETWLDFTDLVFIDPVGTGFSRLVEPDDRLRNRYLSVEGDIEALADAVYRWLAQNGRMVSPKYFVGESYGGFRGPLLAEKLLREYGLALNGLTLLSPVLDFGWRDGGPHHPLPRVSLLPSLAAAAMETVGALDEAALTEVEAYAAGDFLADLLRGLGDEAAVARLTARLAEITGLSPEVVGRFAGRLEMQDFVREIGREDGRVASLYDTGVMALDPTPERSFSRALDPVLDALTAPLTSAALAHYGAALEWLPERRYQLLNRGVSRAWRWGEGRGQPEAVSDLRRVMALDPGFRVLVAHGYTDLVTPYFESALILRQIPDFGPGERLRQATYPGGHMFYTRDDSRRAFWDDARWLYGAGLDGVAE